MLPAWNWDSVLEKVAGTKLATQLRTHRFRQDVQRAGEAQERRARSAPSSMPTSRVVSPSRAHSHRPPDERDRLIDGPTFVLPPGSMRIRRTPFRQTVHYDVSVAPAEVRTPSDHLSVPNSEELCPNCARSPQDSAVQSPSLRSPLSSYSHTPASTSRRSSIDPRKSAVSSFGSALSGQRSDAETVASLLRRRKVRIVLPEEADSAVASDTEDDEDEAEDSEDKVEPEQEARRVLAG
ncbi:hypothetical protein LTR97_009672 [Elasticomyces elasticus]|uniref:Uncharacterized protein n=1 Tax=Elasticomyces elasticus TaxID=574655 RepID=A0AAN7W242_9PEZI|nr:hypothetical protein LTR97_009672 [Elasticomyces elasticus]